MAFRIRKTVKFGPMRLNLSRSGMSVSSKAGPVTLNSRGRASVHLAPGITYQTTIAHTPSTAAPGHTVLPMEGVRTDTAGFSVPVPGTSPQGTPPLATAIPSVRRLVPPQPTKQYSPGLRVTAGVIMAVLALLLVVLALTVHWAWWIPAVLVALLAFAQFWGVTHPGLASAIDG